MHQKDNGSAQQLITQQVAVGKSQSRGEGASVQEETYKSGLENTEQSEEDYTASLFSLKEILTQSRVWMELETATLMSQLPLKTHYFFSIIWFKRSQITKQKAITEIWKK